MPTILQRIRRDYERAGFRIVHRGRGAISLARKAPMIVVDSKGRPRLERSTPAAPAAAAEAAADPATAQLAVR